MMAQGALKLRQHRHPAGLSVPAFGVPRSKVDLGDQAAVAANMAHGQREHLVDAKARKPLHGDQRLIAGLQLADDAEQLTFLGAG